MKFGLFVIVPSNILPCKDLPPGLIVLENFVSEAEENQLISSLHWQNDNRKYNC